MSLKFHLFLFYFFSVATRKFKIVSVAPTIFLLDKAALKHYCLLVFKTLAEIPYFTI